jgi:hypothetical protein
VDKSLYSRYIVWYLCTIVLYSTIYLSTQTPPATPSTIESSYRSHKIIIINNNNIDNTTEIMGCIPSSTAASSAYPGNRRVAQPAYQPSHDEYKQIDANTAVAQAHFVTCPGGNALRLLDRPNRTSGDNPFLGRVGNDGGLAKYISGECFVGLEGPVLMIATHDILKIPPLSPSTERMIQS